MNSLSNKVLLAVMTGDRHGSAVDQLSDRIIGGHISFCALVDPFGSLLHHDDVLSAVVALEQDGLLEVMPGGFARITDRGLRHIVAILQCGAVAESGEDLGDISDHLLSPIPAMYLWGVA